MAKLLGHPIHQMLVPKRAPAPTGARHVVSEVSEPIRIMVLYPHKNYASAAPAGKEPRKEWRWRPNGRQEPEKVRA